MIIRERKTCAVCRGTRFRDFAELGHRHIVRCEACAFTFADQLDEKELERAYRDDYYASADDTRIEQWVEDNSGVWDGLCGTIESALPSPTSLLDVGAGTGGFLLEFHRRHPAARLGAVESSANACDSLRERMPAVELVANDAGELGGVTSSFQVVSLLQTLEHVFEPAQLCAELYRIVEPGGFLLVTVPNRYSYAVTLHGTRDMGCYGNPTHLQFFHRASLERMLHGAGFSRLERVTGYGGSNEKGRLKQTAQYLLRRLGRSNELRYLAWK